MIPKNIAVVGVHYLENEHDEVHWVALLKVPLGVHDVCVHLGTL